MTPAKEVGGDFYDFFLIDDTHLGLVMADVSGKGVPAALFMMISKILVQNYAMTGRSTAEVLRSVNEQICSNNREEMFVTVWFGILDTATGKITAANAGHEYPVIMQTGSRSQLIKDKHGFVIGGMEGIRYRESFTNGKKGWEQNRPLLQEKGRRSYCKKSMRQGSPCRIAILDICWTADITIFVNCSSGREENGFYLDGVLEATDPGNVIFGTQRMLDTPNRMPEADPETLLRKVHTVWAALSKARSSPCFDWNTGASAPGSRQKDKRSE